MTEVFAYPPHELYGRNQNDLEMSAHLVSDYANEENRKDKKHLSLGMLVPDAIQFICAEGSALRWDESASCYEVFSLHQI